MAQHKGTPFLLTQVRQPLPGKDTFDADDHILAIGSNDPENRVGGRRPIFVDQFGAVLIEKTDMARACRSMPQ
jgi:hypothetical protein